MHFIFTLSTFCTFYFHLTFLFSSFAFEPSIFHRDPLFSHSLFIIPVMHFISPLGTICTFDFPSLPFISPLWAYLPFYFHLLIFFFSSLAFVPFIFHRNLLIPRDPLDCDRPPDPDPPDPSSSSRRPADVWVPRGPSGNPEAWDFSVTSAFRLGPSTPDPAAFSSVFSSVETRKRGFLDTASHCAQAGIHFCPLVIEAVGGGWSEALRSVVSWIASESGRHSSSRQSDTSFKIAQRISCALHQENARAILKRAPEQAVSSGSSLSLCLLSEPAP